MPVNANLSPRIALTSIAMIALVGCTASISRRPGPDSNRARTSSVQPMTAPSFSAQQKPMTISGSTPPATSPSALVSLYGELQTDWQETAGGPWDGSSNVAQITFATEGACSDPDISRDGS
ncbi:MAG: hypothetical protein V3S08_10640, partial [Phycisphaerales bacterium]